MQNNAKTNPAEKENALKKFAHLFSTELKMVDEKILSLSVMREPIINSLLQHLINSGGKRLRPTLVILSSKLCGEDNVTSAVNMAACVELLHTATLFHDDVVDESKLRRGAETANEIWGNAATVLVGDFLLAQAFFMMSAQGSMEVIDLLSSTSIKITEGEIKQLVSKTDITISEERYYEIITAKTAELFAACTRIGGIIHNQNDAKKKSLEEFGRSLGIAFQLADDALDYSAAQENLGKKIGDDFREGKVTLPLIHALVTSSAEDKKFIEDLFSEDGSEDLRNDVALTKIVSIMQKHNSVEYTLEAAKNFAKKAIENLQDFADSEYKTALIELTKFSVERYY